MGDTDSAKRATLKGARGAMSKNAARRTTTQVIRMEVEECRRVDVVMTIEEDTETAGDTSLSSYWLAIPDETNGGGTGRMREIDEELD